MKRTIFTVILTLAFTAFAIHAVEQTAFEGAGIIESTTGGFKFPDGSVQLSAISPPCTAITYLPYAILEEGVYCLTGNLETSMISGHAITIAADNVVIDLNGWMLDGTSAGTSTEAHGIYASQRRNITIRNGTIRGFFFGIWLSDSPPYITSHNHLIESIRFDQNTIRGILVFGSNIEVHRNQIVNTGGSTAVGYYNGINLGGPNGRVINNDISNTVGATGQQANGIFLDIAHGAVVAGNRISSVIEDGSSSFGIRIQNSDDVQVSDNNITSVGSGVYLVSVNDALVRGNNISNADHGITFSSATGKYRDNLTSSNVTTPFTGGTDAGGNN